MIAEREREIVLNRVQNEIRRSIPFFFCWLVGWLVGPNGEELREQKECRRFVKKRDSEYK